MTARESVWQPAPLRLLLGDEDVHVWRASLNQTAAAVSILSRLLTPDEAERAGKYYFQKDRDHFIVARAVLRQLLGSYLRTEPAGLRFRTNAYGKPALDADTGQAALRFNLAHSLDFALYAFTRNREVGVDLEYVRQDFATAEIAERYFSAGEVLALNALPESLQTEGFYRCWTRKEAYVKAVGQGLSLPLERFDVSLLPDAPAALLNVADNPSEAARWSLWELTPAPGYMAALAVEGKGLQLTCFAAPV